MRAKALLEEQAQRKRDREVGDLKGVIALLLQFGEHAEANEKKKELMEILSTPLPPVVMPAVPEILDVGKELDGKDDGGREMCKRMPATAEMTLQGLLGCLLRGLHPHHLSEGRQKQGVLGLPLLARSISAALHSPLFFCNIISRLGTACVDLACVFAVSADSCYPGVT